MTQKQTFITQALSLLEDYKGQDIMHLNLSKRAAFTEHLILCTGQSTRHLNTLSKHLTTHLKNQGLATLGVEGDPGSGWVLVDYGHFVVHLMLANVRDYYKLEKFWA